MARLEKDMKGEAVQGALLENHRLAEELGIRGTPMFIIGGTLTLPGAVSIDEFRTAIHSVREERSGGEHKAPPHSEPNGDPNNGPKDQPGGEKN